MSQTSHGSEGDLSINTDTINFLGLPFAGLDHDMALAKIRQMRRGDRFFYVITPNVDHMVQLENEKSANLTDSYANADLLICDSRILAFLARRSGLDLKGVPGSDLTRDLLRIGDEGWKFAVIGGNAALHQRLEKIYPSFQWQFHQPPMGVRQNPDARQEIAEFCEAANADLIFFAIGAPQSEITCREIALRGKATGVALCIGASLEFLTGAKSRAPRWMQRFGLEWLHRLGSEPGRLWRRYLVEGPKILSIWWRWKRSSGR